MPKYEVTSRIEHGAMDDKGTLSSTVYEPGDTIELSEEEATSLSHALADAPKPESDDPELEKALDSVRRRPDHVDSGVTAIWKVDAITASELKPRSDEAAKLNEEAGESDPKQGVRSKTTVKSSVAGETAKGKGVSPTGTKPLTPPTSTSKPPESPASVIPPVPPVQPVTK